MQTDDHDQCLFWAFSNVYKSSEYYMTEKVVARVLAMFESLLNDLATVPLLWWNTMIIVTLVKESI